MALRHRVGWDPEFTRRSGWFWPLAGAANRFGAFADWPARADLNAMYAALAPPDHALRFVDNVRRQDKRDAQGVRLENLYDARIAVQGEVPTRERDWHDFFNALCFATFPRSKLALHRRQYAALERRIGAGADKLPGARTKEQDALTLFDEGGALIAAERPDAGALSAADAAARPALLAQLTAERRVRVVPFGHALFEHLVEGLRCPGGATRIVAVERLACPDDVLLAQVDQATAALLRDPAQFLSPSEGGHIRLDELGIGSLSGARTAG